MRTKRIRDLCIFLGYALCLAALREVSVPHWYLSTGFRLGVLLMLPVDYWPAVVLADCSGTLLYKYNALHMGNVTWFFWSAIAPSFIAPLAAYLLRACRWNAPTTTHTQSVAMVLKASAAMSILFAGAGTYALSLIGFGQGQAHVQGGWVHWFSIYFVGHYLGCLMVVPAVVTYQWAKRGRLVAQFEDFRRYGNPSKLDLWLGTCAIVMLTLINIDSSDKEVQLITRALMVMPMVLVAMRRGWTVTVALACVANLALRFTMREWYEPSVVIAQIFLGACITGILGIAAMRTEGLSALFTHDQELESLRYLARQAYGWSDGMVRRAAIDLEKQFKEMVDKYAPHAEREHASTAIASADIRWSMGLTPSYPLPAAIQMLKFGNLEMDGLRMALTFGALASQFRAAGIYYSSAVSPRAANLPRDMQIRLFQLANELAMDLCHRFKPYRITVKLRSLNHAGRVVALRVKVWPGEKDVSKLPGPCLYSESIWALAKSFNGKVKDFTYLDEPSITVILRGR